MSLKNPEICTSYVEASCLTQHSLGGSDLLFFFKISGDFNLKLRSSQGSQNYETSKLCFYRRIHIEIVLVWAVERYIALRHARFCDSPCKFSRILRRKYHLDQPFMRSNFVCVIFIYVSRALNIIRQSFIKKFIKNTYIYTFIDRILKRLYLFQDVAIFYEQLIIIIIDSIFESSMCFIVSLDYHPGLITNVGKKIECALVKSRHSFDLFQKHRQFRNLPTDIILKRIIILLPSQQDLLLCFVNLFHNTTPRKPCRYNCGQRSKECLISIKPEVEAVKRAIFRGVGNDTFDEGGVAQPRFRRSPSEPEEQAEHRQQEEGKTPIHACRSGASSWEDATRNWPRVAT